MFDRVSLALIAFVGFWLGLFVVRALPHDASEPDAAWFNDLRQPETHISCCGDDHDCRAYDDGDVDIRDGAYFVRYRADEWLRIPKERVLDRTDNPTGHFVACVHMIGGDPYVLCAVRGTGA